MNHRFGVTSNAPHILIPTWHMDHIHLKGHAVRSLGLFRNWLMNETILQQSCAELLEHAATELEGSLSLQSEPYH